MLLGIFNRLVPCLTDDPALRIIAEQKYTARFDLDCKVRGYAHPFTLVRSSSCSCRSANVVTHYAKGTVA